MKRVLVGLSYGLQGIGNLALALFLFSSLTSHGGFYFAVFLLVGSILSFVTVWSLFEKNIDLTSLEGLGTVTSAFFIGSYGLVIGMPAYSNIEMGYHVYQSSIGLLVYLGIVVLNVVSIIGLFSVDKEERMDV